MKEVTVFIKDGEKQVLAGHAHDIQADDLLRTSVSDEEFEALMKGDNWKKLVVEILNR